MLISMLRRLRIPERLILFVIVMLIFGISKLAGLGKSLGEGVRRFKSAMRDPEEWAKPTETDQHA